MQEVVLNEDFYYFNCPHCSRDVVVLKTELNCQIFRCGIYKHNYQQVDPHLQKIYCDKLVAEDKVFGCCKPFEIIRSRDKYYVVKCDYK